MVGVPGRSKACHTCRRRRKGCDLERPSCGQCSRLGLQCDGYERRTMFIHADPTTAGTSKKSTITTTLARKPLLVNGTASYPVGEARSTVTLLPTSLTSSAYKCNYVALFWEMYDPHSDLERDLDNALSTTAWLAGVHSDKSYHNSPLLQTSFLAFCLGSVGHRLGQKPLIENGMNAYNEALRGLSKSIAAQACRNRVPDDATVATTRILSLYEVFFGSDPLSHTSASSCPGEAATFKEHVLVDKPLCMSYGQADAWHRHRFGELALLESQSPDMYKEGIAHRLLADGRLSITIAAVGVHRSTILAREDWLTVPWTGSHKKTSRDLLLDIFVQMPGCLEDMTKIEVALNLSLRYCSYHIIPERLTGSGGVQALLMLIQRCQRLLGQLHSWFDHDAPLLWKEFLSSLSSYRPQPPNVAYPISKDPPSADDVSAAHLMCLYWSTRIKLMLIILDTTGYLANLEEKEAQNRSTFKSTITHDSNHILRTAPIFFQKGAGIAGSHLAIFPLTIALKALQLMGEIGVAEQRGMVKELLVKRAAVSGLSVGGFVGSLRVLS
ncbi:hypothetical protein QBC40DRAFT_184438 [Triangularia verruculosa]|uniref:Zn(2)-C6 fungal-type domain-containing protein n=1 Tax=Triangularia verruculosa TaxID=2587418 RepID=A0AAN6X8E1_9PEZI|nr:hypothetical protein QBC40DRAFT_184438 [Triangularia verruculosa]